MEARGGWGWNLEEMRDAAGMDPQQVPQAYQYPIVSGFTPVNPPGTKGAAKRSINDNGASTSKTEGKAKASNRRKTQPTSTSRPRKVASTKKLKRSKTAKELQCQDISQGLPQTKPTPFGNNAPLVKTAAPSGLMLSDPKGDTRLAHDASADVESPGGFEMAGVLSCPSGLADKYQLTYAIQVGADDLPKPAIVGVEINSSMGHGLIDDCVDDFEDFLMPTSAQGENFTDIDHTFPTEKHPIPLKSVLEKAFIKSVLEKAFNSDEVFSDQDEADEFLINDEGLEEIMQSIAPPKVYDKGPFLDWQPQDSEGDHSVFEEPEEHVQSDGRVQASSSLQSEADDARLPIYQDHENYFDDDELDEDLTVMLSNRKAPGSPELQSEADYAKRPEGRNSPDNEEHYQGRFTLSDGPVFASPNNLMNQSSRVLSKVSGNATKIGANHTQGQVSEGEDHCFDDDELDEDIVDLTADGSDIVQPQTPLTSPEKPPSSPKLRWMPSKTYTPTKSSQTPAPHTVAFTKDAEVLPFTRPPFPKPILDRSPILGLTNRTVLRTCFRIGEALNAAAVASRTNTDAIIELYARIILSERELNGGFKQFFQFGDMFTDKPPYLSGTYTLWKGVDLWDVDSKPFLGEKGKGKTARVMGRIKRCEQRGGCEMIVLSIWEVDWEDIGVAKGIVCS